MPGDVHIEWEGEELEAYGARLRGLGKGRSARPLFEALEYRYLSYYHDMFESEGGPVGGWAQLSKNYLLWKAKKGYSTRIGVMKGKMRESFTGGIGYQSKISDTSAYFGQRRGIAATKYTGHFDSKRSLAVNSYERSTWAMIARDFFRLEVEGLAQVERKADTLRAHGVTWIRDKNGIVRFKGPGGRFVSSAFVKSLVKGIGEGLE